MIEAWHPSKTVIKLDEPPPLGKYLGCNHTLRDTPSSWIDSEAMQFLLRDGSADLESLVGKTNLWGLQLHLR